MSEMEGKMDELRVPSSLLRRFAQEILQACGVPDEDGALVAASLVQADACGLTSHGTVRLLPVYVRRLRAGTTCPQPQIEIVQRRNSVILLDGGAGLGQVVGSRAVALAVEMASAQGVGVVGVRNSSHFGAAAFFLHQIIQARMIGLVMTNAPSNMPPWGGRSPYFGTNPIAIGLPRGHDGPMILDMSTSVVARGRIVMAALKGESIPPGWAIDAQGRPTQDAQAALEGAVLPVGGYKGSGLAAMVDALCGVLTGAAFGAHIVNLYDTGEQTQNLGHFFLALDVESFMPLADFQQRMDQFAQEIRTQPKMEGVERIFTPGEMEWERTRESEELGILLPGVGVQELDALATQVQVSPLSALLTG